MKAVRRLIYILVISICFNSCKTNNEKIVEGDLYFKLIDFQNFFDAPDSVLVKFENSIRNTNQDSLSKHNKEAYNTLLFMIDNNQLRKPFIRIRLDNGEIKMLFLDRSDYLQFKKYNWSALSNENKKIRVKANVTEIKYDSLNAFNTIKLLSVDKIDGQTYWKK